MAVDLEERDSVPRGTANVSRTSFEAAWLCKVSVLPSDLEEDWRRRLCRQHNLDLWIQGRHRHLDRPSRTSPTLLLSGTSD